MLKAEQIKRANRNWFLTDTETLEALSKEQRKLPWYKN